MFNGIIKNTGIIKTIKKNHIDGPLGVRGRNSDNTLIREKLGWDYSTTLEEGIRKTYNWIMGEIIKDQFPVDGDKDVTGKKYLAYGNCNK